MGLFSFLKGLFGKSENPVAVIKTTVEEVKNEEPIVEEVKVETPMVEEVKVTAKEIKAKITKPKKSDESKVDDKKPKSEKTIVEVKSRKPRNSTPKK